jgi:hypothetical protein
VGDRGAELCALDLLDRAGQQLIPKRFLALFQIGDGRLEAAELINQIAGREIVEGVIK